MGRSPFRTRRARDVTRIVPEAFSLGRNAATPVRHFDRLGGADAVARLSRPSGNDDAEERSSGLKVGLTSKKLVLVDSGKFSQIVGMKFAGVDIPEGATIVEAHVQFQVYETDSGPVSLVIRGQAADDREMPSAC